MKQHDLIGVKASLLHSGMAELLTLLSKKLSSTPSKNETKVRAALLQLAEYAKHAVPKDSSPRAQARVHGSCNMLRDCVQWYGCSRPECVHGIHVSLDVHDV